LRGSGLGDGQRRIQDYPLPAHHEDERLKPPFDAFAFGFHLLPSISGKRTKPTKGVQRRLSENRIKPGAEGPV